MFVFLKCNVIFLLPFVFELYFSPFQKKKLYFSQLDVVSSLAFFTRLVASRMVMHSDIGVRSLVLEFKHIRLW